MKIWLGLLLAACAASAQKLTIEMAEPAGGTGVIMVAVFRGEEGFPLGKPYRTAMVDLKDGKAVAVFDNLEPGEYAVTAFHDRNKNGKLDRNIATKPTEPYGFSNDARGMFGPPKYQEARFEMTGAGRSIAFQLK